MICRRQFEGDRIWHMGSFQFRIETGVEIACNIVKGVLRGGVGGDPEK